MSVVNVTGSGSLTPLLYLVRIFISISTRQMRTVLYHPNGG